MGLFSKAWGWLRRPLVLAPSSAAVGAGAIICSLQIPDAADWASAFGAFFAAVIALHVSRQQIRVAQNAAAAERETALELQERDANALAQELQGQAMRLAHAFSRELVLARRDLMVFLANVRPPVMERPSNATLAAFLNAKPLPDLQLVNRFADSLAGFKDEDAFAILTLLAAWSNFNRGPGIGEQGFWELAPASRRKMASNRFNAGRELVDAIARVCNALAPYYEMHPSMTVGVVEELPRELTELFRTSERNNE